MMRMDAVCFRTRDELVGAFGAHHLVGHALPSGATGLFQGPSSSWQMVHRVSDSLRLRPKTSVSDSYGVGSRLDTVDWSAPFPTAKTATRPRREEPLLVSTFSPLTWRRSPEPRATTEAQPASEGGLAPGHTGGALLSHLAEDQLLRARVPQQDAVAAGVLVVEHETDEGSGRGVFPSRARSSKFQ